MTNVLQTTRRWAKLGAGVSAAALLSGCISTMAPKYERPTAPVPQALPQGGTYPAATPATVAAPDLAWRDVFTDPKLQQVITTALANNRDLRVSILNIAEAHAQYRVQRAALIPHIDASFAPTIEQVPAALLSTESTGTTSGATGSIRINEFAANLGVTDYELDLWGRVRSLSKQALETYLATTEAKRAFQISLISEVATDYVTYSADLERLNTAKATVQADTESVRLTTAQFNAGVVSEVDVREAQTALEQASADVPTYTTTLAQDVNNLTLLVGAPVSSDLLPGPMGDTLATLSDIPAGVTSDVLLRRPDVVEAEHTLKAYNANIGAARAAFFPTIELTGGGGSTSLSLGNLFGKGTGAWSFTPTVTLPVFEAGINAANLRYAKAERDVAVAQYEKAVQTAFQEVANALAQRGQVSALVASNQRLVFVTDRSVFLAKARYTSGADTYLNTLTAEVNAYSARQALVSARLVRATNLITLYQTLGGGVR